MDQAVHVIGLLGGVASGKSVVARELARLGAGLLDADRAGHQVLGLEHVRRAIRKRWGPEVFGADGEIDRGRLARIVFAPPPDGPREREYLEQLTHPEIGRLLRLEAARMADRGVRVVVLDAPLLVEAGWEHCCDTLVFVDAPRQLRLSRARKRGWTEEEFEAREKAQQPLEIKRQRAQVVMDNSGSLDELRRQVEQLWRSVVG